MSNSTSANSSGGTRNAPKEGTAVPRMRCLIWILWVLIILKCLLLQWAVVAYDMPINAWWFVWVPSLLFALVCTIVYWRMSGSSPRAD